MAPWALAALLLADAGGPNYAAQLRQAIHEYETFAVDKARGGFEELIGKSVPREVRAKAHFYLGLIAFDAGQTDRTFEEFAAALAENPAIEPPPGSSPKVELAFSQARADVFKESIRATEVPAPALALTPAAPPITAQEAAPRKSHALSWVLGGAGAVAAVVAIYGGVQVANYESFVNSAETQKPTPQFANANHSNALAWEYGWISAAAIGVACLGGAVLTW
jgi:hypothetical protein